MGNRRPLRKVTYSAMGRDDVGIVPYGCIIDSAVADPSVTAMPRQLPLRRGAPFLGTETVRGRTRLFPVARHFKIDAVKLCNIVPIPRQDDIINLFSHIHLIQCFIVGNRLPFHISASLK